MRRFKARLILSFGRFCIYISYIVPLTRSDTAENRINEELLEPIKKWDLRNRVVYPPVEEVKKYYEDREEECPRIQPPFVVHSRQQIRVRVNPFTLMV